MSDKYVDLLINNQKKECITFCFKFLEENDNDIIKLYDQVLRKSLITVGDMVNKGQLDIWSEHLSSSIVRSCIENCYLQVKSNVKKKIDKNVLIFCPKDEQHEIGALMVSDYFTMLGFNSFFVGAQTPETNIDLAIKNIKPEIVAISVSNFYNLSSIKHILDRIKKWDENILVFIGGYAIQNNSLDYMQYTNVEIANSFLEIKKKVSEHYDID